MKPNALRLLSLCTLIAAWEIAGRTGNARLLPPVSKVMSAWLDLLLTGQLFQALGVSLQALTLGFILSVYSASHWGCSWDATAARKPFSTLHDRPAHGADDFVSFPFWSSPSAWGCTRGSGSSFFLPSSSSPSTPPPACARRSDTDRNGQVLRRQGKRTVHENHPARRLR